MEEKLKWIKGYEGMYFITSFGRVFSVVRRDRFSRITGGGEISHALTKTGYHFVGLYKDGVGEQLYVHKLVAEAFISNPENKTQVDHIDNNKGNNTVRNLRWCTAKENMNNEITRERMLADTSKFASQVGADNPFARRVGMYSLDGKLIKEFESASLAGKETGIPDQSIGKVCRGERMQTHGYIFKYLSEARMKIECNAEREYRRMPVIQLDLEENIIAEYPSIMAAAEAIGAYPSNLGKTVRGQHKTCKGYKWRYK